jgi:hypothetical protein
VSAVYISFLFLCLTSNVASLPSEGLSPRLLQRARAPPIWFSVRRPVFNFIVRLILTKAHILESWSAVLSSQIAPPTPLPRLLLGRSLESVDPDGFTLQKTLN